MNKHDESSQPKRRRWRRWGYWTFIGSNVVGLIIIIPLMAAVLPLLKIWWNTRSDESLRKHTQESSQVASTNSHQISNGGKVVPTNSVSHTESSLEALTNQLGLVSNLDQDGLDKIIESQFGKKKRLDVNPGQFDRDSAVFHEIKRTMETINGKKYFCYELDLVDQNGNHKINVDYVEKPDADYERSMATLALIKSNPQLQKIYKAFSHVLAEKASAANDAESTSGVQEPALRLEKAPAIEKK